MAQPVKLNFKMYQGSTFREVLRWESSTKVYKPITGITKSAPIEISCVGNEIPEGWRVKITNVAGMVEINSEDKYHVATDVLTDSFKINAVNAVGYKDYVSGGIVEYNQPVDLTGVTARMQLRPSLDSSEVILELTTENGGILVANADKTISLLVSATATAALTFSSAVYSLELIKAGEVTPFINGTITLVPEVTR